MRSHEKPWEAMRSHEKPWEAMRSHETETTNNKASWYEVPGPLFECLLQSHHSPSLGMKKCLRADFIECSPKVLAKLSVIFWHLPRSTHLHTTHNTHPMFSPCFQYLPGIRLKSPMSATGVPCANLPNLRDKWDNHARKKLETVVWNYFHDEPTALWVTSGYEYSMLELSP